MALIGNRYEMLERIGMGAMAVVYRAIDHHSGRPIAVKLLRSRTSDISSDIKRFEREVAALRLLNHPNIIKVFDSFSQDNRHYIIMEYIAGGSLAELLEKDSALPVKQILEMSLDIAGALTRTHRLSIIHRDIKPANILIADDGRPRLTDFGLAYIQEGERITRTGAAIGTLDYLPPEALNGDHVDERADIWAFGVMLFEMIAGRRPYISKTVGQLVKSIANDPVPEIYQFCPDCPPSLGGLIHRILDKNPETRIPSIRLVGVELERILRET